MLTGIRAVVFDAYGTLFDVTTAVAGSGIDLGGKAGPLAALWRDKQLQYSWLRSLQRRYVPFWQVTGEALAFALETLDLPPDGPLHARLMARYRALDAFPDAPGILQRLRRAGFEIAILSNGSPEMLASVVGAAGLADLLDAVLSVDAVGTYKPDPRVYQLAVDHLAVPAEAIAFVSSNGWDAYAAAAFGMRAIWCNRAAIRSERLPGTPAFEVTSLSDILVP
jgi:2-haloacid dehalogenase